MCLIINYTRHKQPDGSVKARKAEHDMKVLKIFDISIKDILRTPYRLYHVKKVNILNGMNSEYMDIHKYGGRSVSEGIHAFIYNKFTKNIIESCYSTKIVITMYIPKGTYYWYGTNSDIVAQRMCFYKKDQKRLLELIKEE